MSVDGACRWSAFAAALVLAMSTPGQHQHGCGPCPSGGCCRGAPWASGPLSLSLLWMTPKSPTAPAHGHSTSQLPVPATPAVLLLQPPCFHAEAHPGRPLPQELSGNRAGMDAAAAGGCGLRSLRVSSSRQQLKCTHQGSRAAFLGCRRGFAGRPVDSSRCKPLQPCNVVAHPDLSVAPAEVQTPTLRHRPIRPLPLLRQSRPAISLPEQQTALERPTRSNLDSLKSFFDMPLAKVSPCMGRWALTSSNTHAHRPCAGTPCCPHLLRTPCADPKPLLLFPALLQLFYFTTGGAGVFLMPYLSLYLADHGATPAQLALVSRLLFSTCCMMYVLS